MLRRGIVALAVSLLALLGGAATTSTAAQAGTTAASCWTNAFAWVSTFPSNQGNLSGTLTCNVTVQKITLTMLVHRYSDGAVVTTVGPQDTVNTTSAGIKYAWYCSYSFPQTLYGEVRGSVTEYGGAVLTGTWYTPVLSC